MSLQQWSESQANPEVVVNRNFQSLEHQSVYGQRQSAHSGLVWGYYGGRWGGNSISDGTFTLSASATNYLVVALSNGAYSASTSSTNWDNADDYARAYKLTTSGSAVTATEDHRAGPGGVHGSGSSSATYESIIIACSDEITDLTVGALKATFRMPYAFTLSAVRASVSTAPTGDYIQVGINASGSSILSTDLTIDAGEKTSTSAAVPAVISNASLNDDEEITIDINQVGSSDAGMGLKIYLIGNQ